MNFLALKNELKSQNIEKCYYLCGDDDYLLKQSENAIIAALNVEYPEMNINRFFDNINMTEVMNALLLLPFMTRYRVVVLRELQPSADDVKYFKEEFLKKQFDNCVCIIVNKKSSESLKGCSKYFTQVECNHPSIDDCTNWIIRKFKLSNLKISTNNAYVIAEYTLCDMTTINLECEKLISLVSGSDEITLDDIQKTVSRQSEFKIYEFTNAIAIKDKSKAYTIMESLLEKEKNKNKSEVMLLGSIYQHFRRLLFVSITNKSKLELAELLSIKEYAVTKTMEQARKFTPKTLKSSLDVIDKVGYMFRCGKMDVSSALNLVVLKLINL